MPGEPRIFLSYGRGDDEPFVRRLYDSLVSKGFDVWFDREAMPNRGLTFLREIQDAITARDRLLLVVGPTAVKSDYVQAEWQWASNLGKPINPVLRLGDYDLLPDELKLLDAPDFRKDGDYMLRLKTLLRQLAEPISPLGKLIAVPSLPNHFLCQRDRLRALKDAVLADLHRPVVMTGTATRTGVQGMGGIGKSVLATAVARDHEVRRAFPDGVFWVPLGQQPALVSLQSDLAKALGADIPYQSELQGKAELGKLLADKAALLVLDDAWQLEHAQAFDVLGPRGRLLVTTRDAALLTALGGTQYQVQLPSEEESLVLLAQWAGQPRDSLPAAAHDVMKECGRLPLAISICGAMVHGGQPWSDLVGALREADLEFLDHPHGNVLKSIKVSVDALAPAERERFAELSVFPPDETVPEAAVVTLWTHTLGQQDRHARQLLTKLERRALVRLDIEPPQPGAEPVRRVSLHDLLYDYSTRLTGDRIQLHDRLLAAYRAKCPAGWESGPNDGYFLEHAIRHFAEASHPQVAFELLSSLDFLRRYAQRLRPAGIVSGSEIERYLRYCLDRLEGLSTAVPTRLANVAKQLDAFSEALHLLFGRDCGALDSRARCNNCGVQGIFHGYIDLGAVDVYDNYSCLCPNCFWAWHREDISCFSSASAPRDFDYTTNKY